MSNDSPQTKPVAYHVAKFSLASILLLTAVVAVYLGGIRAGLHGGVHVFAEAKGFGVTGGLLVGTAVGLIIGLGQPSRLRSSLSGVLVGMLAGAGAGLLVALPGSLRVIIPGAILLLVFATVVRRLSRATVVEPEAFREGRK